MAAVLKALKKKAGRANTKIAVVEHPECDSYSIKLMSVHQRKDLSDVILALDEARPKDGTVVVFTTSAPMAVLYANYIAIHFGAEVVECAGHTSDTCACADDYIGEVSFEIIIESAGRASLVAGAMENRLQREADYPQKFGAARLFSV